MAGGLREFTAEELLQNRGVDGSPVYIAVRGQVYDVSAGRDFYGPGGPYEVFAGRECSRALAMMKIEEAECKDDMSDLTDKQITTLQDWVRRFSQKYPVVGRLIPQESTISRAPAGSTLNTADPHEIPAVTTQKADSTSGREAVGGRQLQAGAAHKHQHSSASSVLSGRLTAPWVIGGGVVLSFAVFMWWKSSQNIQHITRGPTRHVLGPDLAL